MSQLEDSLVALYKDSQECVGAGVLVRPDLVLTCAHVVNLACGRNSFDTGRPDRKITLRFHSAHALQYTASVDADKEAWSDPPPSRVAGADLCLLRLDADAPTNVIPATLCIRPDLIEHKFRVAGFPADYEGDLDIAQGEITGRDQYGLFMLQPGSVEILLMAAAARNFFGKEHRVTGEIYEGFSGAPV